MNSERVQITIQGGDSFSVAPGDNLFRTLRGVHVFIPTICGGNGFCGKCRLKVLAGASSPVTDHERKKLSDEELAAGWRLSCQVLVQQDMTLELPDGTKDVRMFSAKVVELEMMSHDVRRARLELITPDTIRYLPGAFILLDIPPAPGAPRGASRSYSIATPPSSTRAFEINVKLVPGGIGSGFVHNTLKVGDTVTFTGPYSGYADSAENNEIICVAGGSGMSPVLSILRHLKEIQSSRPVLYFFGVKTSADLLYLDELHALEKTLPSFRFVPVLEVPTPNERPHFETGLVTQAITDFVTDASGASAYLCGSPGMLGACCSLLTKLGISDKKIFFDKFG